MSVRLDRRAGFTLIELIVSIAIVGVLIALLLPAVQAARGSARTTTCRNQLRQLGMALHMYHDTHRCFPVGSYVMGPSFPIQSGWGWGAMLLPYIEQEAVYKRIDFRQHTGSAANLPLIAKPIPFFRCPSEIGPEVIHCVPPDEPAFDLAAGNYCGSEGVLAAMTHVRIAHIVDGTSRTLMLGEHCGQVPMGPGLPYTSAWAGQVAFDTVYEYRSVPHLSTIHAINASFSDPQCFSSYHPSGANFVLADGSVQFITETIDSTVFTSLGTRDGGEAVSIGDP